MECQIDLWRGIVPPSQVPKLKWPVLWYIRQNPPLQAKKACVLVVIPPPLQMSHLKPQTSNLNESEWVREHYTNSIKLLLLHAANPASASSEYLIGPDMSEAGVGSWNSEVSTEPSSHPRGLLETMNYSRSEPDWARVAGAAARIRIRQNMRCGLNHCLGKCRGGGPAKTAARLALSALSDSAFLLSLNLSWTLVENVGAQAFHQSAPDSGR